MTPDRALGFSQEGDVVTLRMTINDWLNLLFALGIAIGSITKDEPELLCRHLALVNRLNAGNPHWTAYGIPEVIPE